jgi:hypothetical protein
MMSNAISGGGRPSRYKTKAGEVVPGVTTILKNWGGAEGLIRWSWKLGMEGKDYRTERNRAAGAGTLAHALIEAVIHQAPPDLPGRDSLEMTPAEYGEAMTLAEKAVTNFRRWAESTRLEVTETEVPLISDAHRYGGTLDAVGRVGGALCYIDWKSSNSVRPSYIVQCAAYRELWREVRCEDLETIHLLRVDKEFASFSHHQWNGPIVELALEQFLLLRRAYDIEAKLKKAAA